MYSMFRDAQYISEHVGLAHQFRAIFYQFKPDAFFFTMFQKYQAVFLYYYSNALVPNFTWLF